MDDHTDSETAAMHTQSITPNIQRNKGAALTEENSGDGHPHTHNETTVTRCGRR